MGVLPVWACGLAAGAQQVHCGLSPALSQPCTCSVGPASLRCWGMGWGVQQEDTLEGGLPGTRWDCWILRSSALLVPSCDFPQCPSARCEGVLRSGHPQDPALSQHGLAVTAVAVQSPGVPFLLWAHGNGSEPIPALTLPTRGESLRLQGTPVLVWVFEVSPCCVLHGIHVCLTVAGPP